MSRRGRGRGRPLTCPPEVVSSEDSIGLKTSIDQRSGGDSTATPSAAMAVIDSPTDGGDSAAEVLSQSLDKKLIVSKLFTERPNTSGTNGRPIGVFANHFRLGLKDMTFFHYDIDIRQGSVVDNRFVAISESAEKKMKKLAQKENIGIIEKLAKEWPQVFRQKQFVFDGLKNLYTRDRLDLNGQKVSKTVGISFNGFNEQLFEVWIQFTNDIKMSSNQGLFGNRFEDNCVDVYHVLEIILRYKPTTNLIPVGSSLYNTTKSAEEIAGSALISFGHFQSVHMTQSGPTLVVDRTATLFRTSGPLIQFLLRLMPNIGHEDITRITFNESLIRNLSKQLSGIRVSTKHTGGKRVSVIDCLSSLRAKDWEFNCSTNGETIPTNVFKYFKDKYNIELKCPDIPLIKLKGGVDRYVPIEVLEVMANQPILYKHITPSMTASIVRKSGQQSVTERFKFVEQTAESIAFESKDLLNNMGITLSTKPIGFEARVLDKPDCRGTDRKVFEPKDLKLWSIVCLSSKLRNECKIGGKVEVFIDSLIKEGLGMGLNISKPVFKMLRNEIWSSPDPTGTGGNTPETILDEIIVKVQEKVPNIELVVFAIPYNDGTYPLIKRLADIKYGLMTQCVRDEHVLRAPKGFFNNLLLKINSKLNGKNSIITEDKRPDIMKDLMVIGADVTHPAPADRTSCSIAAAVASYDTDVTKYTASVRVQPQSHIEIIIHFNEMIAELLEQYMSSNNNNRPKGLLVFRDGVSEGQFKQVLDSEYKQVLMACRHIDPQYSPKITFICVQKRHHTRFIPKNPSDASGRAGNIPPGTVVDTTVVNPVLFEYYLCSHTGLIGTSRPAKYVVLHDDHNMSFDEMEKLSYYLCHTYARTSRPISIPTPMIYSHLAAKRAKEYISERKRQTAVHSEEEERSIAIDLNDKIKVNPKLRSLLYYC